MNRETKILLKRTSSYYLDPVAKTVNPNVGNYILLFGELMYLKDAGWIVLGEGAEYNTQQEAIAHTQVPTNVTFNEFSQKYIGGPTVSDLIAAHKYLADAKHTKIYGNATFQYLNANGDPIDIPISSNDTTIANTKFVQDVVKTLDGAISGTPAENKTLTAFTQTDGKVSASFAKISLPYDQIFGAGPQDKEIGVVKMDGPAEVGDSPNWSREDHRHPTDTSRASITTALSDIRWDATNKKLQQKVVDSAASYTDIASMSALLVDATLSGNATAPTVAATKNDTTIATTEYVTRAIANKSVVETKTADTSKTIYVTGVENANGNLYYSSQGTHGGVKINCSTGVLMGAAWNDFAEYRKCQGVPGTVVCETGKGDMIIASERLQPGASVISDTYGMVIGDDSEGNQPIAVAGRVLALYGGDLHEFKPGMPVCAGPFGRIYPMTREEIKEYPEAIVGYVSEIPTYDRWNNIEVNNRIWIKVK